MTNQRTVRLLVVEDDPSYRYLIEKAFSLRRQSVSWEIAVVEDGEAAIRVLFEEQENNTPLPQLILLDWHLPRVKGMEVLQRAKQHEKLRRIPVLVFSSSKAEGDIKDAYSRHANGYLVKPDGADLLAALVGVVEEFWAGSAQLSTVLKEEFRNEV